MGGCPAHAQKAKYAITGPGGKRIEIEVNAASEGLDQAYWKEPPFESKYKTRVEEMLANEAWCYNGRGYVPVPDGFRPLKIMTLGKNVPTLRFNCAGLSLARLVGGWYNIDSKQAHRLVEAFGTAVKAPYPHDLAI